MVGSRHFLKGTSEEKLMLTWSFEPIGVITLMNSY